MNKPSNTGLKDSVVAQSSIADVSGQHVSLAYRGYDIKDLCQKASFEEVAYLLLHEELPSEQQLHQFNQAISSQRNLPQAVKNLLESIPKTTSPMDVLRAGVSLLGCLDPEYDDIISHAVKLIAKLPYMLLYWYRYNHQLDLACLEKTSSSTASYFLQCLHDKPCPDEWIKAIDISLILYAEHDFNASTFAARVTTSTLSDYYSAICSAIGTLKGPLHGGANEKALELIQQFHSIEEVDQKLHNMLQNKEKIMGFGHRVYRLGDPRSPIVQEYAKQLSSNHPDKQLYYISECIENIIVTEKNIYPNLDFYTASMYHFCNIPIELFTPIFVLSRITGWTAHIIEQRQCNKLIRPLAEYIGPKHRDITSIAIRPSAATTE